MFASRSHARALAAGLPGQDHIWITTNSLFRFHNNEFDEMPCKLKSTEYAHLFRTKLIPALNYYVKRWGKYGTIGSYHWTHFVFVKHILLHIRSSRSQPKSTISLFLGGSREVKKFHPILLWWSLIKPESRSRPQHLEPRTLLSFQSQI